MPQVSCKICINTFYVRPNHLNRGWGKYCSKQCQNKSQLKGSFVVCETCASVTWRSPKDLRKSKSGKFFCGKSCQTRWRNKQYKGSRHANWRGGEYTYQRIMKEHGIEPVCKNCDITDKRVLLIHHIDHNRKNNNITNLVWLCRNCHYLIHDGKTV